MQFKQATAVLLVSLIGAQGTAIATRNPIPQREQETEQELILLNSEITSLGNLTFWGLPDHENSANPIIEDAAHSDVYRRCGSNKVECTSSNLASRPVCSALADSLSGKGGDVPLPKAPRSVCLKQANKQCCVSWANEVGGLVRSNLYGAAKAALDQCPGGTVSAEVKDVHLRGSGGAGGVCTKECINSDPNSCHPSKPP